MASIKSGDYKARLQQANGWEAALKVLRDAANATGGWGVSNADQKQMTEVIKEFQRLYPAINIDEFADAWDISKNSLNIFNYKSTLDHLDTATERYKNQSTNSQINQAVQNATADTNKQVQETLEQIKSGASSPSYSAGGSSSDAFYQQQLAEQNKKLDKLWEELQWANEQLNKKWTADELAEYYNVQDLYDYDRLLENYNNSTNEYFDDYQQKYNQLRTELNNNSWRNAFNTFDMMRDETKYNAGTQSNIASNAAVELASQLGTQQNIAANDYENLQIQNAYEAQRLWELENNPLKAQQDYNTMAATLMSAGTNLNDSLVRQAMAANEGYSNAYADYRTALDTQYKGYTSRYQGLANAAASNAQAAVNRYNSYMNSSDLIYKMYQAMLGNNAAAAKATGNRYYSNNGAGSIYGY